MITGIGVDVVDNSRMALALKRRPQILNKILNKAEQADLGVNVSTVFSSSQIESIAVRFAAKEAASKALGVSLFKIGLDSIEILRDEESGAPKISVNIEEYGEISLMCSLSHSELSSVAVVLAQR